MRTYIIEELENGFVVRDGYQPNLPVFCKTLKEVMDVINGWIKQ